MDYKYYSNNNHHNNKDLSSKTISMVINLFISGFSFDTQDNQYSWSSVVGEEMSFALDHCILTPAIDRLLSTGKIVYYEGGVVIEVRDYRYNRDSETCIIDGNPFIYRLELLPNQHTLFADIESRFNNRGDDILLRVEEELLKKLHPICIDNSPEVFFESHNVHYNQHKFNYSPSNGQRSINNRLIAKRKRLSLSSQSTTESRRKRQRLGVVPFLQKIGQKPGIIPLIESDFHKQQLDLVNDIEKKFEKPTVKATPSVYISRKPSTELAVPSAHSNLLIKRTIRFLVNRGQDFVIFEVIPKPNGCYDGRLRVGTFPDTGSNGEFSERFSIGNTKTALSFIHNLRDLEYQESNSNGDNMPQQAPYNVMRNRSPMLSKSGQSLPPSPQPQPSPDQKMIVTSRPPQIPPNNQSIPGGQSPLGNIRQSPLEETVQPISSVPPFANTPLTNGIPQNVHPMVPNMPGPSLLQPGALHSAQRMMLSQPPNQPQSPQQPPSPQQLLMQPLPARQKSFMGLPVPATSVVLNTPAASSPQHNSPPHMSPEHVPPNQSPPSPPSEEDSESSRRRVRGRGRVRGTAARARGRPRTISLPETQSVSLNSSGLTPTTPPRRGRTRGRPKKT